jgi:hypothetical protein
VSAGEPRLIVPALAPLYRALGGGKLSLERWIGREF